jgi:hypothetical protein
VVQTILEVIKVFALGLNNPLTLIVRALIDQIKGLQQDLQRAGVYIHGDWYDLKYPFDNLAGGFQTYESRMVRRLTDPNDPERPIISPATTVAALFLYVEVDPTAVATLVRLLLQFVSLFGQERKDPTFPNVINTRVGYGWENLTLVTLPLTTAINPVNINRNGVPSVANITWQVTTTGPFSGIRKFAPPVHGFLVEVSVYENGLIPVYSTPISSNTNISGTPFQQFGRYVDVDGNPITLFGGADQIKLSGVGYNNAVTADGVEPGSRLAYLVRNLSDSNPSPMELLTNSSVPLLQRTFFVRSRAVRALYLNQKFSFQLKAEDLPYELDFETNSDGTVSIVPGSARRAKNVYVRIRAVDKSVTSELDFKYEFTPVVTTNITFSTKALGSDVGDPSPVFPVVFPAEEDTSYLRRIQTAFYVLALSRPDLDPEVYGTTGLESYSRSLLPVMTGIAPGLFYRRSGTTEGFRKDLDARARGGLTTVASYLGNLPEEYKARVVDSTEILDTWKWSDGDSRLPNKTIAESVEVFTDVSGVSRNINSLADLGKSSNAAMNASVQNNLRIRNAIDIGTVFVEGGLREKMPVIVKATPPGSPSTQLQLTGFVRDARSVIPSEVYSAANQALLAASAPLATSPGGWIQLKLFTQGIPVLNEVLDEIINFLEELDQGLKGTIDAIIDYIDFLVARVRELTELIIRIDSYLNFLLNFQIPQCDALFFVAPGTAGVVDGLVSAEDKPLPNPNAYGGGVVAVASGLPTFIIDIIRSVTGG